MSNVSKLLRRQGKAHRARTPLTTAVLKTVPEQPRHRADSPTLLQQAAVITPAAGLALVVLASNAGASAAPTDLTAESIPVITVPSSSEPVVGTAQDEMPKQRLDAMRDTSQEASRSSPRTHVTTPHPAPPAHPAAPASPHVQHSIASVPTQRQSVVHTAPPPPSAPPRVVSGGTRDRIIAAALTQLGVPYVYGEESPGNAFDCSGLTQWVFGRFGFSLPRTANDQYLATAPTSSPQAGDLVFYLSGGSAYHVGIYYHAGKMIVAPHSGTAVQVETIWGSPVYRTALG